MSALRTEENPDRIVKIFMEASQHPRFHRHRSVYAIAVKRLADAGRYDAVERILEHQKTQQNFSEGFMLRIITLYGQAGMTDHAVKTFRQLPEILNGKPGAKSLNALLNALQLTGEHGQVPEIYRQVTEKCEINPNLNTFTLLVKSMCEIGLSENAFETLDEMRKYGYSPGVDIFNLILKGFYEEGKPYYASRVLEKMSQFGCCPDVDTYNIRVLKLCREGKSCEAKELLSNMRSEGVKPDVLTYNLLINGFCRERNLMEANRVFVGMASKGCDPNKKSFYSMIYYLCVEEEFEWALELCHECVRKNWIPSMPILEMLVEGLLKILKTSEGRRLLSEVRLRLRGDFMKRLDEIAQKLFGKNGR